VIVFHAVHYDFRLARALTHTLKMEITLVHTHTHNIGYDSASQIPGHIESRMKWRHCRMGMALRSMAIR
jgi:hypothetical protein